jgi:hypothetical protein
MDNIGLTPAERAEAQVFISPKEMDELILRGEISDTKLADRKWTSSFCAARFLTQNSPTMISSPRIPGQATEHHLGESFRRFAPLSRS